MNRTQAISRGLLEANETPALWRERAEHFRANGQRGDAYLCDRRARDLEAMYGYRCWMDAAIKTALDREIAKWPDAEKDRELLRNQLISFFSVHGYLPEFTLEPRDRD